MSRKREPVVMTLTIAGETDRDPWEWADCIARSLAGDLNENNGEGWPAITVEVDDVM